MPSLPGYTLSFAPGQKRFGVEDIAATFIKLMTEVLGYKKFGTQGGDWGAFITSRMAAMRPELFTGLHLNYLTVPRDSATGDADWQAQLADWVKERSAYSIIQGTRPQTLAYGLTDSPAGLAAWIAEKFHAWTDNDGTIESAISRDDMLANISLYWFTGAIGSSFWTYYARTHGPWPVPFPITVPTAHTAFPNEILRPPRAVAEKYYTNIKRWTEMEKGGHFAALEQPDALARDITAFFKPYSGQGHNSVCAYARHELWPWPRIGLGMAAVGGVVLDALLEVGDRFGDGEGQVTRSSPAPRTPP